MEMNLARDHHARRIAMFIHALYGGGAERLMSQLASRWSHAGHEVHLITLADTSTDRYAIGPQVIRHGLGLMRSSTNPLTALTANWRRVAALRQTLSRIKPELVVSFCDRSNIVAITATLSHFRKLDAPLWIAEHSDPQHQVLGLFWETWRQWAYRALARQKSGGCVVLTPGIAAYFERRFRGLSLKVIPPAIDLKTVAKPPEIDVADRDTRLIFLGRLSPEKNLVELLRAWQSLASQFPQWHLIIAGDGPQREDLIALAAQLKLVRCEFAGWIADPAALLASSDLFVLPSRYEGFPVALLEAMGSGVASVSTPCSSALPALAAAGAVITTESFEANSIASTLASVMADGPRRAIVAQQACIEARKYSWDAVGKQWDELIG